MEKIMDTREFHAQSRAKISQRIAVKLRPRVDPSDNPKSPGLVGALAMCIAPRISEDRNASIEKMAYSIAQRRGFSPGHELDDWLTAEKEVDARLIGEHFWY
jgi:hypothetical protein